MRPEITGSRGTPPRDRTNPRRSPASLRPRKSQSGAIGSLWTTRPGEPAPIMRPRPHNFDNEVELVYDETGQRVPVKERLGPRLTNSQRRKR
jgi:hypothetical protein